MRMKLQMRSRHRCRQSLLYARVFLLRRRVLTGADALRLVVHDLHLHQHVLESHSNRTPETNHSYDRAVCLRIRLVLSIGHARKEVSPYETGHALPEIRNTLTVQGAHYGYLAPYLFPNRRAHLERGCYIEDTGILGAYDQGPFASPYCHGIQYLLQDTILDANIFVPNTAHLGSNPSMLGRLQRKLHWLNLRICKRNPLRRTKHCLKADLQRRCCCRERRSTAKPLLQTGQAKSSMLLLWTGILVHYSTLAVV